MTRHHDSRPQNEAGGRSRAVFIALMAGGAVLALIAVGFACLMLLFGRGPEGGVETSDFVWLAALALAAIGCFVSATRVASAIDKEAKLADERRL